MSYLKPFLFVLLSSAADIYGQGLRGNDSFRTRSLYSFGISAGSGACANAMGYFQTYVQRVKTGTEMENLNLLAVTDQKSKDNSVNEDVTFGVQLGFKYPFKNKIFQYAEIPVGVGLYRYNKRLNVENNTQPRYPTVSRIDATIITLAPSVGIVAHSRPVMKHFGFCAGVDGGLLYGKYGSRRESDNSIQYYGLLSQTLATDYKIGAPIGIKYNASCDLNIELYYYPYVIFNGVSKPSENAAFFQSFRLLLRYKLYQKPVDDNNRRTDMFF